MRRFWSGLAIAIAFAAITAGSVVITQDEAPAAGEANSWVVASGAGSCTRSATPISYETAVSNGWTCGPDWDDAWDAATAGDTIRIKDGSYPSQTIDGDKASSTLLIGESTDGVAVGPDSISCDSPEFGPADGSSGFCIYADNVWIENATIDAGTDDGSGSAIRSFRVASDVTFRNVNVIGDQPTLYVTGPDFTWWGGEHGNPGETIVVSCDDSGSQPIQNEDLADNTTIRGITIHPWDIMVGSPGQGHCGEDATPHLEYLRVQGTLDGLVFRDNTFVDGSEFGSGYIFTSGSSSSTGWQIINNYFPRNDGGKWIDNNPASPAGIFVAYNTWAEDATNGAPSNFTSSGSVWVGNIGPPEPIGCAGTHIKNVQSGSGSCGTDTFTGGAASALGIDSDGDLEASSPGIDAGETPGASDHCTDAATVNSLDRHGTARPLGSVCDAGSHERE